MSYRWDVFISYRRGGNVTDWVRYHFHPVLVKCLEDELDRQPQVFFDDRMEVGAYWPDELAEALRRTMYLVAVWSPPYFRSAWCVAEWQTMLAREKLLGVPRLGESRSLVYPVVFSDGDSFPAEARIVRSRLDLSRYGFPYQQFSKTESYLEFHAKIKEIAVDLAKRFHSPPEWKPDWPIVRPEAYSAPTIKFPRLGGVA